MKLPRSNHRPRAFVLIATLIVVMLAAMIAMSLLFRMKAEETASAAGSGSEQAWSAAMSGVREAMRVAAGGSDNPDVFDAPGLFRERFVFDDGSDRWHFTVYSPGDDSTPLRNGHTDEAGKLNFNHATEEMLARLPGMKPLLTHALLDFIDADDIPLPEGAEQPYYDTLPQPYAVRNGPLDTVDELLLIRGFTPALLYGEDANPYRVATSEGDAASVDGFVSTIPLRPLLTVSSFEPNTGTDGAPRWDLNNPAEQFPTNGLPVATLAYIAAMRASQIPIAYASDLLDAKQMVKSTNGLDVELASGITKDELPLALDLFTTVADTELPGLINVNTASRAVLATVPGLDEAIAEAIVSTRQNIPADRRRNLAWLVQENVLDAAKFRAVAPYLTTRGFQFSFRVIGYGVPSGRYRVLEVIVDTARGKPVITYLRDITRLGLPFKLELSGEPSASNTMQRGTNPVAADVRRLTTSRASVLDCGSPLPLLSVLDGSKAPEDWRTPKPCGPRTLHEEGGRPRCSLTRFGITSHAPLQPRPECVLAHFAFKSSDTTIHRLALRSDG